MHNGKKIFASCLSAIALSVLFTEYASAEPGGASSLGVQIDHSAKKTIRQDISENMKIFTVAAQKYVFENTGNVPWNTNESQTPVSYASFLLFAGAANSSQAASVCGFSAGSGQTVPGFSSPVSIEGTVSSKSMANAVNWSGAPDQFLPNGWNPAFQGTYCAVVQLNIPSAKEASIMSYYVAPNGTVSHSLNITMQSDGLAYKESEAMSALPITGSGASILWKSAASSGGNTAWQVYSGSN